MSVGIERRARRVAPALAIGCALLKLAACVSEGAISAPSGAANGGSAGSGTSGSGGTAVTGGAANAGSGGSLGGALGAGGTPSTGGNGGTFGGGGSSGAAGSFGAGGLGGDTGTGGAPSGGSFGAGGFGGDGGASGGGASGSGGVSGSGGASGSGGSGPPVTFRNPLNTSHGSDPWLVYYEGHYYLAATTWGNTLTMKRGRTIAELKAATPTVIWQDSNPARCCNMWAPEFYLLDGPNGRRWYHYYTAGDGKDLGTQRSHVLESEGLDPMGPYTYRGQLLDYWAIDGSLLEVNGSRYFMFSAWDGPTQNVWVMAMTNPWTVTGNRTLLTAPTYDWEREGSDPVNEGPVALYHGGRTFVVYSASQCADPGYKLGLLELVGSNPLSQAAWTKRSTPVFQAANGAYGTGHNGFFKSPDGTEDWIVYHATTNPNGSCWTDRTTRIQKFGWNADGTPNFGTPLSTNTDIVVPSGE